MKKKEKTVFFVMQRLPFPVVSGRKTSLYHYCRILSEELGFRLVVAAFLENGDNLENIPDFIDKLVILPKASVFNRIIGIIKNSIILRKVPMQVSLYWNPKAKRMIDALVREESPNYVIGDMVRSTEYIKDIPIYRIADLDDRISLRYQRQLKIDIDGINPYGAFLNTFPYLLQKLILLKPLKVLVLKNEIALLRKYELEIGRMCEKTIFVAAKEADEFNRELGEDKAIAVPTGVDTEVFSYRETGVRGKYIGFLGAIGVAHNESAVHHFIEDIFPLILQKHSDAKFLIIGGGASEKLMKYASDKIEFTGHVDDVIEYLEKCKVFVCPMTFGSGIKTKILEAMSLGIPVVTTTIGAENIEAVNTRDWIVEDDNEKFSNAVCELLSNEEKRLLIGKNGGLYVRHNFTWNVTKKKFAEIFTIAKCRTSRIYNISN